MLQEEAIQDEALNSDDNNDKLIPEYSQRNNNEDLLSDSNQNASPNPDYGNDDSHLKKINTTRAKYETVNG